MKKIFTSLFFLLVFSLMFSNFSFAQTNGGITVATVNINNAKIISQNDRDFMLSFDISNKVGIQPQVRYSVRLTQIISKNEFTVDQKVYDEIISIGENTTINKNVEYIVPSSLPAGIYRLWIDSKNQNGLTFGVAFLGEVKILDNKLNFIEIVPGSCSFFAGIGQTSLSQGSAIGPSGELKAKCKVNSNFPSDVILKPYFITRSQTVFGEEASTTGSSTDKVLIKNGTNNISLDIPKGLKPQVYNLTFGLVSEDSKITSNSILFNYVLSGPSGNIQNVVFDKTYYRAGETANLQIFSTQNGTSVLVGLVSSGDGESCTATTSRQISSFSIINLALPIIKDCNNPKANITILAGDKVLDSNNFQVTTVKDTTIPTSDTNKVVIAIITAVFVLIFGVLIYKKKYFMKYFKSKFFIFSVIFLFIFLNSNLFAQAAISSVSISALSNSIPYGASTTISWEGNNVRSCSITRSDTGSVWQNSTTSYGLLSQLNGSFSIPTGIVVDPAGLYNSNVYVVDTYNNRVQKFNSSGTFLSQFGTAGSGNGQFNEPFGAAIDSTGNIYVTDKGNNRVQKFNSSGTYLSQFGSRGYGNGQFSGPSGIAIDSLGNIYVADTGNNRVQKFNSSGTYLSQFGTYGSANGQFWYPYGIAVDTSGNIFVTDQNNRVQIFNSSGVYVSKFGSAGTGDGQFGVPLGIAFSKWFYYQNGNSENIYVADRDNNRVQIFNSSGGFLSKIVGFYSTRGVAIDSYTGYIYVADGYNNRVQKFTKKSSGSSVSGPLTTTTTFTANCDPASSYDGTTWTTNSSSVTVTVLPPLPAITLTPALNPVPYNGSTTISWTASGDISSGCTLSGNGVTTAWPSNVNSASISSGPLIATTTFSLTCTGLGGTATKDLVMSVLPPPGPALTLSSVFPVPYNGSTTVWWTAINSSSCTLYKDNVSLGAVNPISGSTSTGNMITNAVYLLSCSGIGGSATTSPLTVTVLAPMSIGISAYPNPVAYNGYTTVSLSSTGANYCKITKNDVLAWEYTYSFVSTTTVTNAPVYTGYYSGAGVVSSISLGGTPSPLYTQISTTTVFIATCNNRDTSTSTSIIVEPIIPITVNLISDSPYVLPGGSANISWSSTGALSCEITKDGSLFGTGISGSKSSGPLSLATTFVATCINKLATTTQSLIVAVDPIVDPPITPITISLSPLSSLIPKYSSTTITWSAPSADSCTTTNSSDNNWIGTGISNSKSSGVLTATTTFITSCINSYTASKYIYNHSGTYTVPPGVNSITVEVWGGGGKGGQNYPGGAGGGGGGGGGYGKQTFSVNPGDSYPVTVGIWSESSSLGTLISASGGSPGGYATTFWAASLPTSGGAGGVSSATINVPGEKGSNSGLNLPGGKGGAGGNGGIGGNGGVYTGFTSQNGGAGTAPGGGGGGASSGFGTQWGGSGSTGRVIITPSSGTSGINYQSKSTTVNVFSLPSQTIGLSFGANPLSVSSGSSTNIYWDFSGADSCTITGTNGDSFTTSYSPDSMSSSPLTSDTTFTAVCSNVSTSTTASVTVSVTNPIQPELPAGSVVSTCTASQGTSTVMYVNRTTRWTATLNTTSTSTPIVEGTNWSGTNIYPTGILPGLIYDKIYTTIGFKNITGVTTGTLGGKPFSSTCLASTTIEWNPGTGGEI